MRFTAHQYDQAIEALQNAKTQLEPDGHCCAVCGDSGHMAHECGFNPLVAVMFCKAITDQSRELHETLHHLAGYEQHMGVQMGPARVVAPHREEADEWKPGKSMLDVPAVVDVDPTPVKWPDPNMQRENRMMRDVILGARKFYEEQRGGDADNDASALLDWIESHGLLSK